MAKRKKDSGLSRVYSPPKDKPQYGANWDNLAHSETTGRVEMPPVDYPLQSRDVALGVRFAKGNVPVDARTHNKVRKAVQNTLSSDKKPYADYIANLFGDMAQQGLPVQKGKNEIYFWYPKDGGVTRFASDRDLIEGFAGYVLYPNGYFPVEKLKELTPKQTRALAEAYAREGDRYAESSKKGDVEVALGSYANAERIYETMVHDARKSGIDLEGTKRTLADLDKKYGRTLERLGSDKEALERAKKARRNFAGGLERGVVSSVIAIAGVLGGIFFLSTNVTGNAIADLTTKTTSFLGAGLLIVGLVAGFFWIRARKK